MQVAAPRHSHQDFVLQDPEQAFLREPAQKGRGKAQLTRVNLPMSLSTNQASAQGLAA